MTTIAIDAPPKPGVRLTSLSKRKIAIGAQRIAPALRASAILDTHDAA